MRTRPLLGLVPLLCLLFPSVSGATEWHPATGAAASGRGDVRALSARHLRDADELRLRGVELGDVMTLPGAGGTTVRLAQTHGGLPVFGGQVAVRVKDGQADEHAVRGVAIGAARGLTVGTTPALTEADARAVAQALAGRTFDPERVSATLGVLPDAAPGGALVWQVDVPLRGGHRYYVDAVTGELLRQRGLLRHAKGRVYGISSANTPAPTDAELSDLDPATPATLNAFSGALGAYSYKSGSIDQGTMKVVQDITGDADANFLFDPPKNKLDEHDAFANVNAYYHIHRIRGVFTDQLGVDMSSSKWTLGVVTNVMDDGSYYDNAAFAPQSLPSPANKKNTIVIGQGSESDFAYDSDVFLHEFTHYVAHNAINYSGGQFDDDAYGLNSFGGAIDEGTADYFACTTNGDPILGEASLGPLGAERDLEEGGRRCPEDLVGEVHYDGRIIGNTAWAVRKVLGKERGDKVVWGSMSLLTHGTSLGDFGTGLVTVTKDLVDAGQATEDELAAITKVVAERGLDDCGHVLSLDTKARSFSLPGLGFIGQFFGAGCDQVKKYGASLQSAFHLSRSTSADAKSVRFDVTLKPEKGSLDWAIHVRKGQHVAFSSSKGGFPVVSASDYVVKGLSGAKGSVVIDATSDPPFEPGATYYMVLVHQSCASADVTITATDDGAPLGTGGAAGTGGAGGAGGSGTAGSPATTGGSAGSLGKAGGASLAPPAAPAADAPSELVGGCALGGDAPRTPGSALALLGGIAALVATRRRRAGRLAISFQLSAFSYQPGSGTL